MTSERLRRIGENEAMFRQVNTRLEELNESLGEFSRRFAIVCECGSSECSQRIDIDPAEYQRFREDPTLFIIAPGHEAADVERVVAEAPSYEVVRKAPGEATQIATETQPLR